jgi:hypothetical protein
MFLHLFKVFSFNVLKSFGVFRVQNNNKRRPNIHRSNNSVSVTKSISSRTLLLSLVYEAAVTGFRSPEHLFLQEPIDLNDKSRPVQVLSAEAAIRGGIFANFS